jgi:hypothetical protein
MPKRVLRNFPWILFLRTGSELLKKILKKLILN